MKRFKIGKCSEEQNHSSATEPFLDVSFDFFRLFIECNNGYIAFWVMTARLSKPAIMVPLLKPTARSTITARNTH